MKRRSATTPARAFTLLEVLISLALIASLLGAMFSFYLNLLNTRERIREHTERMRAADMVIDHIERGLTYCVAGDAAFGAGIRGDERSIEMLTRAVAVHDAAQPSVSAAVALHDLHRLSIRSTPAGAVTMQHASVRPGSSSSSSARTASEIARQMGLVRLRYHDGEGWVDSFDSVAARRLPRAVEVAIWFEDPRPPQPDGFAADDPLDADDPYGYDMDDLDGGFDDSWDDVDGFDERERWPLPDRVRVIFIPGADVDDVDADDFDADMLAAAARAGGRS